MSKPRYTKLRGVALVAAFCALPFLATSSPVVAETPLEPCSAADLYCPAQTADDLAHTLETFPTPNIAAPNAMFAAVDFKVHKQVTQTVTYSVVTRGATKTSKATFEQQIQAILDDPRGWSRLGVKFERVASGGSFTMVLATATEVPSYGAPCDVEYNCNVGSYVIANEDRWLQATTPWNNAGGTIHNYRHLVVNHELGHWLGHGHPVCSGQGQASPVMQQQSLDLHGCKFNAWPLDTEIWSTRLGI